jgi:phage FluMu gp28-like protein
MAGAFMSAALVDSRMRDVWKVVRWSLDDAFSQQSEAERRRAGDEFIARELSPAIAALDADAQTAIGEDFARDGDLTVIIAAQRGKDRIARCPLVVEMRNVPYQQQDQVMTWLASRAPHFVGAAMDARGSGRYLAESAAGKFGGRIQALTMAREWYAAAMPAMKAEFEDGTIEVPRDPDLLADLRSLRVVDGIAKPPEKRSLSMADRGKRHGDGAIALALALFALASRNVEYGFIRVPRAREAARSPMPGAMAMQPPQEDFDGARSVRAQMEACF